MTPTDVYALAGVCLFVLGATGTLVRRHLVRRILGLNIMGSGVFLVLGALAARDMGEDAVPRALVITGIVVSLAMTALALAIASRLYGETGAIVLDP